jgi:ABC-2 type transport system permease protein
VNLNVLRKNLSDRWRASMIYAIGILGYLLMIIAVYPTFKKTLAAKSELLKNYPKQLLQLFGVKSIDAASFNNYMTIELLGLIWVVIMAAFVIAWTRAMIAGEISDGTMELLLAQPVARWRVIVSESTGLLAGVVGLCCVTVVGTMALGAAFGARVSYAGFGAFLPLGIALALAVAGYSLFFSALLDEPRRAVMASAGLTLFFYLLHFGGTYSKVIDKIDWFGIFHYYNPMKVLDSGKIPVKSVLILLVFAAVGFGAATWVFQNKDIK